MKRNLINRWFITSMSLALFAAACVSSGGDGVDADGAGTDVATPDAAETDAESSRTTLAVATVLEPPTYDPIASGGHGSTAHVMHAILMPLLYFDNQGEFYSNILESWETSDDGLTVTLVVSPDVRWSDGMPVTSADVLMTLTQYLDPSITPIANLLSGIAGLSAFQAGEADSIAGLSAPDDRTVVVELEDPDATWIWRLAARGDTLVVLPAHVLGDVPHDELVDHPYFDDFPVTNGPYKWVEWVPGQHVELERSDDWSLGEAGFERVFFRFVAPDALAAQLQAGELQFAFNILGPDADRVGSLEGVEIQSTVGANTRSLYLMSHEPLLDRRVRRAIAHAIDREGICEAALSGYCTRPSADTSIPQLISQFGVPTSDVTQYPYDPDRARELLDEAGWDPNTTLVMLNRFEDSPTRTVIEIVQGNLAGVGINVEIVNLQTSEYVERLEEDPASFHMFLDEQTGLIHPSAAHSAFACDAHLPDGVNVTRYCNETLDELAETAAREGDLERSEAVYQDFYRLLNEEVPAVVMYGQHFTVAYDSHLRGVKAHGSYGGQYWNIGEWHWED